ncbi:hypothetical protein M9H77_08879 [Catharanthus roseus]|uniref:Uncharacterized protein n=1 Tax=Catharanthus roseus TaxID=4058 RepID=A0ACC0BZ11_CATRO|nr:hypothetical protein M9H77_08879 [Catharanthus roseus]
MVSYNKPQSLRSAVQLGIPDAIHQHGKPMKLSDLVSSIQIILLKHHPLMRPHHRDDDNRKEELAYPHIRRSHCFFGIIQLEIRLLMNYLIGLWLNIHKFFLRFSITVYGSGALAKTIAGKFPDLVCIIVYPPHVVAGLEMEENLEF